jgi:hypothetical protein
MARHLARWSSISVAGAREFAGCNQSVMKVEAITIRFNESFPCTFYALGQLRFMRDNAN